MEWLLDNWQAVLPVALFLFATVANALLKHYGDSAPGLGRAMRVVLDIISALVPKDSPGTVKLPLTRSKPPVPAAGIGSDGKWHAVSLVLAALLVAGCGSSWHDVTNKSLDASNKIVRDSHAAFIDATTQVCVDLAKQCKGAGDGNACAKFEVCRAALRNVTAVVVETHEMVAVARQLVIDARETEDKIRKKEIMDAATGLAAKIAARAAEIVQLVKDIQKIGE